MNYVSKWRQKILSAAGVLALLTGLPAKSQAGLMDILGDAFQASKSCASRQSLTLKNAFASPSNFFSLPKAMLVNGLTSYEEFSQKHSHIDRAAKLAIISGSLYFGGIGFGLGMVMQSQKNAAEMLAYGAPIGYISSYLGFGRYVANKSLALAGDLTLMATGLKPLMSSFFQKRIDKILDLGSTPTAAVKPSQALQGVFSTFSDRQ